MAVTVDSYPPTFLETGVSVSYPFVLEMTSTVYGTANITQHRFKIEVTGSVAVGDIGDKYTVAYEDLEPGGLGRFDLARMLQTVLPMDYKDVTAEDDITKITDPQGLRVWNGQGASAVVKEQYYDNGVFTENTATPALLLWGITRGWTDLTDNQYYSRNWYEYNGLEKFLSYSGYLPYLNYVDSHNPNFTPTSTNQHMAIEVITYPGAVSHLWWFDRDDFYGATYFPIYFAGETDQADFERVQVKVYTNTSQTLAGATTEEDYDIYRTVSLCEDEEFLVMFQNRFYAWSFLSFSKKHYTQITTEAQRSERIEEAEPPGRYRYNVEGSDTLTLNTDFMDEDQNDLIRDLIQTEHSYLVNSDGSLDHIVIVPNSITLKTRRNDELFQYSMRFRLSVDNFAP